MALISLIVALLLEQWRPLSDRRYSHTAITQYAAYFEHQFNAGENQHGVIAWMLAILPLVLGAWLVYALLAFVNPLLALAFNVAALYFTMGFRQFSHYFTDIQTALKENDLPRARAVLSQWRGHDCAELPMENVVRLTIEQALAASYGSVFSVIFWFVLLPGPSGVVLYRLSHYLEQLWGRADSPELSAFGRFSLRAFALIDWLPARLSALTFAIVGDFEDAIYCWRTQAARWMDPTMGIVIAAGAGALGVRLGNPYLRDAQPVPRPELGLGDEPDLAHLDSTVGLVWRTLVLWLAMLFLLGIASVLR
ncbi:MAG: CobD/CbiB family protein [Betaproteobacteria bacterium]|nr:CobD/CbiB family protein [Betaproteobacteria bacterium]